LAPGVMGKTCQPRAAKCSAQARRWVQMVSTAGDLPYLER
jgi:hypothetical protein